MLAACTLWQVINTNPLPVSCQLMVSILFIDVFVVLFALQRLSHVM